MLIQPNRPVILTSTTVVRIPAPALSAVVAGAISVGFDTLWEPALGFPVLVPPDELVSGGAICCSVSNCRRLVKITDIAAICWPTPCVPSQSVPFDQLRPQVRPLLPPEHCFAAAIADVLRAGRIVSLVKGAIWVV